MKTKLPLIFTAFLSIVFMSSAGAQGPRCSLSELTCGFSCPPGTLCPPSVSCCSAPVLCSVAVMDGYSSTTIPFDNPWFPIGWCGTTENIQFLGFVATSPNFAFSLTPYDCQDGNGIQVAVYATNCDDEWTQLFCQSDGSPNVANVWVTLTPGEIYYIVIDGFAGDFCNFDIDIISSGPDETTLDPATAISGPGIPNDMLCSGTFSYFTPTIAGAQCYNWSVNPPIATIDFPDTTSTQSVEVTFALPGTYELCVQPDNFCVAEENLPDPYCEIITILPAPRRIDTLPPLCSGDTIYISGIPVTVPGRTIAITLPSGCDSIYQVVIPKLAGYNVALPDIAIQSDSCVMYLGNTLCPDSQIFLLQMIPLANGCDSTLSQQICVFDHQLVLNDTFYLECSTNCATLRLDSELDQTPNCPTFNRSSTLSWFNPQNQSIGVDQDSVVVCAIGEYRVVSELTVDGTTYTLERNVIVTQGTAPTAVVPIEGTLCSDSDCYSFGGNDFCDVGFYEVFNTDCDTLYQVTIVLNGTDALSANVATITDANPSGGGRIELTVEGGAPPYTTFINGNANGTSTVFDDLFAGDYLIEVVDANGCSVVIEMVTVGSISSVSGIDLSTKAFWLFPNPTDGFTRLHWQLPAVPSQFQIRLFDVSMSEMDLNSRLSNQGAEWRKKGSILIDTNGLPAGIYLLMIRTDGEVFVEKLIVL